MGWHSQSIHLPRLLLIGCIAGVASARAAEPAALYEIDFAHSHYGHFAGDSAVVPDTATRAGDFAIAAARALISSCKP